MHERDVNVFFLIERNLFGYRPFFSVDDTINRTEVSKPRISISIICDDSIEVFSKNDQVLTEANNDLSKTIVFTDDLSKGCK